MIAQGKMVPFEMTLSLFKAALSSASPPYLLLDVVHSSEQLERAEEALGRFSCALHLRGVVGVSEREAVRARERAGRRSHRAVGVRGRRVDVEGDRVDGLAGRAVVHVLVQGGAALE